MSTGAAPKPVWMLCGTRTCPESGSWIGVELEAFNFAVAERVPVLCPRCGRPLTQITVRQAAGAPTTRGARP